ncbi:MAG: glycosyltransferase family 2 protein [Acidobacteria bacterium]|nr:MAG: glycosyltransferase family 2 protein [Acidobacteriota bacterium]MCE7957507.1 glycosyltransferase family 2 protein [Acidobacteria bacterium ACB2]
MSKALPERPAVLVPAFERVHATRRALASLEREGAGTVVLVDDDGKGGGDELAREFPRLVVVRTGAPAFWTGSIVAGMRWAFANGHGSVLLLNQDVTVEPGYFDALLAAARAHPGALLGSAVLYAADPGVVWSAGGRVEWFGRGIVVNHHGDPLSALPDGPFEADWLFGMGTLVPREVVERIGEPDAARFPMAWGDTDYSLRARAAGVPVLVEPRARLRHEVGAYDARVAGPPSLSTYLGWMRDPRHNLSLSCHAEVWRRHGPRLLWPASLALRVLVLLANFVRIRLLFRRGAPLA